MPLEIGGLQGPRQLVLIRNRSYIITVADIAKDYYLVYGFCNCIDFIGCRIRFISLAQPMVVLAASLELGHNR